MKNIIWIVFERDCPNVSAKIANKFMIQSVTYHYLFLVLFNTLLLYTIIYINFQSSKNLMNFYYVSEENYL